MVVQLGTILGYKAVVYDFEMRVEQLFNIDEELESREEQWYRHHHEAIEWHLEEEDLEFQLEQIVKLIM